MNIYDSLNKKIFLGSVISAFILIIIIIILYMPIRPNGNFPFPRCKTEIELIYNNKTVQKTVSITMYLFFPDNKIGHMEYTGRVDDKMKSELINGRQNFEYVYSYSTLQMNNIHRPGNQRENIPSNNIRLPNYLTITQGDLSFSVRKISASKFLVTRYDDPIYIMECERKHTE